MVFDVKHWLKNSWEQNVSAQVENELIYLESIETWLLHGNSDSIQKIQLEFCDNKFYQSEQYLNEKHANRNRKKTNENKKHGNSLIQLQLSS